MKTNNKRGIQLIQPDTQAPYYEQLLTENRDAFESIDTADTQYEPLQVRVKQAELIKYGGQMLIGQLPMLINACLSRIKPPATGKQHI